MDAVLAGWHPLGYARGQGLVGPAEAGPFPTALGNCDFGGDRCSTLTRELHSGLHCNCRVKRKVALHRMPRVAVMLLLIGILLVQARPCAAMQMPSAAARFAVPVLCTDNQLAAHTKARGTAVIVDTSGLILTAAHVILEAKLYCTLTVLVPNDEWSRASKFYVFTVEQCSADQLLDIAACRITPLDRLKDWSFLRGAHIRTQGSKPSAFATITGFTGWGWFPTVLRGQILPPQLYHTQEGCYCDVAVNVETHEGMSGSPIVDENGEVIGVVTLAGTGKFRGISFGTSMANAVVFLRKHGWSGGIGR